MKCLEGRLAVPHLFIVLFRTGCFDLLFFIFIKIFFRYLQSVIIIKGLNIFCSEYDSESTKNWLKKKSSNFNSIVYVLCVCKSLITNQFLKNSSLSTPCEYVENYDFIFLLQPNA